MPRAAIRGRARTGTASWKVGQLSCKSMKSRRPDSNPGPLHYETGTGCDGAYRRVMRNCVFAGSSCRLPRRSCHRVTARSSSFVCTTFAVDKSEGLEVPSSNLGAPTEFRGFGPNAAGRSRANPHERPHIHDCCLNTEPGLTGRLRRPPTYRPLAESRCRTSR